MTRIYSVDVFSLYCKHNETSSSRKSVTDNHKEYRAEVLTFTKRNPDSKTTPTLHESISDDDANIFFGWAVMKLKNKFKEQRSNSSQTEKIVRRLKFWKICRLL